MGDRSKRSPRRAGVGVAARRARRLRREGSVAITIVLLLGVIFGMVALAVDAGQIYKVRTQAQNAADASVLAAAQKLNGTAAGITAARAEAVTFASHNRVYDGAAVIDPGDVVFGRWSPATRAFTVLDEGLVTQINAVRARTTPAVVDNPFMGVLGRDNTDVNAIAIATGGGKASECTAPMVVGDCGAGIPGYTSERCLNMQGTVAGSNTDTIGWSNLNFFNSNGGDVFATLFGNACKNLMPGCSEYDATGTGCTATCYSRRVDEHIGTNNGNFFNEGGARYGGSCPTYGGGGADLSNPCQVIKQLLLRQINPDATTLPAELATVSLGGIPTSVLRGTYFQIESPMIPGSMVTVGGKTFCSADFNNGGGGEPITGYVTIDIFGVKCSNSKRAVVDNAYMTTWATELGNLSCAPPSGNFVLGRMHVEEDAGPGGGGMPGNGTSIPRLVQ